MVHTENGFGIVQFYLILNEGMRILLMGNGRVNSLVSSARSILLFRQPPLFLFYFFNIKDRRLWFVNGLKPPVQRAVLIGLRRLRGNGMLDAIPFFSSFGVVKAIQGSHQISRNAANPLEGMLS